MVTGKGYPDLSTQEFVRVLSTPAAAGGAHVLQGPALQAFAVMDFDVHGLEIYLTYRFGSKVGCVVTGCAVLPAHFVPRLRGAGASAYVCCLRPPLPPGPLVCRAWQ